MAKRIGRYTLPEKRHPNSGRLSGVSSGLVELILGTPRRMVVGLGFGLFFAAAYSLFVLLHSVVRGFFYYKHYDAPAWEIIACYWAGGAVGGLLVGLLAPLARWWWGGALLGVIAVAPMYAGAGLLLGGLEGGVYGVLVLTLLVGMPGGIIMRHLWRRIDPFGPIK